MSAGSNDGLLFSDGLIPEGENEQFVLPDGTKVGTGMLRVAGGPTPMLRAFPENLLLEDADLKKLFARKSIKEARKERAYRKRNQGQIGSCCPQMTANMFAQLQEVTGRPHVPLAAEHLYMKINGGFDEGALLDRAMREMVSGGCASVGKVPYQSFRRSQVRNIEIADRDAQRFRFHEPFELPSDYKTWLRAVATCLARGWAVGIAWHVVGASMRLTNSFCNVGNGPGNHASALAWAQWVGGEELIVPDLDNTWGPVESEVYGARSPGWGEGGNGLIHMPHVFATRRFHKHFVATSIIDDPLEQAA